MRLSVYRTYLDSSPSFGGSEQSLSVPESDPRSASNSSPPPLSRNLLTPLDPPPRPRDKENGEDVLTSVRFLTGISCVPFPFSVKLLSGNLNLRYSESATIAFSFVFSSFTFTNSMFIKLVFVCRPTF